MSGCPLSIPSGPAVTLRSPAQIVAAVPYLLGFHPAESLVVVGLQGDPRTVCLTLRVDLPPGGDRADLSGELALHLRHAGARTAIALVFSEQPGEQPEAGLIATLERVLLDEGIGLGDALWVRSGRWWSYRCQDSECCPRDGTPVDAESVADLAAASAWLGDVVHRSRADLELSLAPIVGACREGLDHTFEWVSRQLIDELATRGWEAVAEDTVRLLTDAVSARAECDVQLAPAELARMALGLADVRVRDRALLWAGGQCEHAAEALWVELTRSATPPYDAPPATLIAVHAYLRGNGAYARIALERALASDPAYSLAQLLAEGLDRGVPPRALRQALCGERAA